MHFSVPSTLRAYFGHVARAGFTFRYTADGPEGLVEGRKIWVVVTRGGRYNRDADTQTPYLEQFLGFIGLTDIEWVYAEGLAMGAQAREDAVANAERRIDRFCGDGAAAA